MILLDCARSVPPFAHQGVREWRPYAGPVRRCVRCELVERLDKPPTAEWRPAAESGESVAH